MIAARQLGVTRFATLSVCAALAACSADGDVESTTATTAASGGSGGAATSTTASSGGASTTSAGGAATTSAGGGGATSGTGGGNGNCTAGQIECGGSCVDPSSNDTHCGACNFGCGSGSCSAGACVMATQQTDPEAITVDATHIYWTNHGTGPNFSDGQVMRMALAGGTPEELATGRGPRAVRVDATHVYWSLFEGGAIFRADLDGQNPVQIVTDADNPFDIAISATQLFWSRWTGSEVRRADLDGQNAVNHAVSQFNSGAMTLGPTDVYWTRFNAGEIVSSAQTGGIITVLTNKADLPFDIATDGTNVYWSDGGANDGEGAIQSIPVGGGVNPVALVQGLNYPSGVASDGVHVYFAEQGTPPGYADGAIKRVPVAGGNVENVALGQARPYHIVIDGTAVYWTNRTGGTLSKAAK